MTRRDENDVLPNSSHASEVEFCAASTVTSQTLPSSRRDGRRPLEAMVDVVEVHTHLTDVQLKRALDSVPARWVSAAWWRNGAIGSQRCIRLKG